MNWWHEAAAYTGHFFNLSDVKPLLLDLDLEIVPHILSTGILDSLQEIYSLKLRGHTRFWLSTKYSKISRKVDVLQENDLEFLQYDNPA